MTRLIFDSSTIAAYAVMILTSLYQTALKLCVFLSSFVFNLRFGAYQAVVELQPVPHKQANNLRFPPSLHSGLAQRKESHENR